MKGSVWFTVFRYVLVCYAVVFTLIVASLLPALFGFTVTLQQENGPGIPSGSVVVFQSSQDIDTEGVVLVNQQDALVVMKANNHLPDESIMGVYSYHLPYVGFLLTIMKQHWAVFLFVTLFCFILLGTKSLQTKKGE
ncbi:hypothetical protein LZP85_12710 [Priestia flexa]|jgi:hypothetical protein|uniref:Signal peptidase I n=1 Tax=Priestia flexa TaxID=86664 RepID=A0A8I1MF28_9BACI|nr:hypothetical protein [Priestia flexa]MBN8251681.1 hypothetical protein [Priestia flexa]MBN8434902.1 hypothetical protein [Priestia flexa]MCA0967680.1 hypothetical protein [Priestia flexa]RIV13364.1 hypothetical protein D1859_04110 [Priestia flexa]UIR28844.1 hypothetical protein LZP85_12710 [Priestia flexa]